jgi:pimeloyl-ACP methyl ester carboxylesterase
VAPDLRGYGDSSVPPDASSYTTFHVVGDLVALIAELGQPQVRRTNPFKNCSNPGARLLIPH